MGGSRHFERVRRRGWGWVGDVNVRSLPELAVSVRVDENGFRDVFSYRNSSFKIWEGVITDRNIRVPAGTNKDYLSGVPHRLARSVKPNWLFKLPT